MNVICAIEIGLSRRAARRAAPMSRGLPIQDYAGAGNIFILGQRAVSSDRENRLLYMSIRIFRELWEGFALPLSDKSHSTLSSAEDIKTSTVASMRQLIF